HRLDPQVDELDQEDDQEQEEDEEDPDDPVGEVGLDQQERGGHDGRHHGEPGEVDCESGRAAATTTRLPSTNSTRIGVPGSIISPRLTTSTRRPAMRAMPDGRSTDSVTPS